MFNKMGADGSAKANIQATNIQKDKVWGVIHRMSWSDKLLLDSVESGYEFRAIHSSRGILHSYKATERLVQADPFCWYLGLIIAGAKENGFPSPYIEELEKVSTVLDENNDRREKHVQLFNSIS
jgi:hypothetical protein